MSLPVSWKCSRRPILPRPLSRLGRRKRRGVDLSLLPRAMHLLSRLGLRLVGWPAMRLLGPPRATGRLDRPGSLGLLGALESQPPARRSATLLLSISTPPPRARPLSVALSTESTIAP